MWTTAQVEGTISGAWKALDTEGRARAIFYGDTAQADCNEYAGRKNVGSQLNGVSVTFHLDSPNALDREALADAIADVLRKTAAGDYVVVNTGGKATPASLTPAGGGSAIR